MNRRRFLGSAMAFGLGVTAFPALAQAYPARPVKLIVPFPAGGPLDIVGRAIGDKLAASLKQPFILETGLAQPAISAPKQSPGRRPTDTPLIVLGTTLTANPWLYKSLPFDPVKDFRPLSILTRNSLMLAVHPSVPVNSVAELVAFARSSRSVTPMPVGAAPVISSWSIFG